MSSDSSDELARAGEASAAASDDEAPPDIPEIFDDLEASSEVLRAAAAKAESSPPTARRLAPPPKPKKDREPSVPTANEEGTTPAEPALGSIRAPKAPKIEYVAAQDASTSFDIEEEVTEVRPASSRPPPANDDPVATPAAPASVPVVSASARAPAAAANPPPAPSSRQPSQPSIQLPESQSLSVPRPQSQPAISVPRPQSQPSISIPRPQSQATVPRPVSSPPLTVPRPTSKPPPAARAVASPPTARVEPPASRVEPRIPEPPATTLNEGQARHAATAATSYPPPPPSEAGAPASAAPATQPSGTGVSAQAKSSIQAMRIIAIVQPARVEAAESGEHLDEIGQEEFDRAAAAQTAEELSDEDVAPDSSEQKAAEPEELEREEALSIPPEEVAVAEAAPAPAPAVKTEAAKPPPPPRRTPRPPAPPPTEAEQTKRAKQRRPWWEELFSEDFVRANWKISDEQIRREVTFIEESLGVAAGGVVLDLGCGAGHHAVEFASRGYGVVGYDLSLYQLALAAEVAQERNQKINFLQGDMREMAFEEMFDGVFCWNTTFGYFEEEKNLAVAQRVFRALRPGGMFLIDVINRDFVATQAPNSVWFEGDSCVCMDDMSIDFIASRLRVKRSIILDDGRSRECTYSVRLYSFHELGKLLHEVGFRVTEASGHPSTPGVFFGQHSPRVIMLAQRP